jgi:predicted secreted protein
MATANVDQGFGSTITFASSFVGSIRTIDWSGLTRNPLDTTHMGTTNGWMTYLPSDLKDAGELTVEVFFDPSKDWKTQIGAAAATCTLTFPVPTGGTTAGTIAGSAFLTSFEVNDPYDDVMTATIKLRFTGELTFTAAT